MLSKSRILNGLQCPKRLYLQVHQPELAEVDPSTEHRFRVARRRRAEPERPSITQDDVADALRGRSP